MMAALLVMLAALPAQAGLLDQLNPGDVQLAVCRQAAVDARHDADRLLGVWKACLDECERKGLDDIIPEVRGELALALAGAEAAQMNELTADERLEYTLVGIAMQRAIVFPLTTLGALLRDYLITDTGRSRMEDYRTLTFRWSNRNAIDSDEVRRVNDVMRRYVEEAGLRWEDFGTARAADADVVLTGTFRREVVPPTDLAFRSLPRVETVFAIDDIRFRKAHLKAPGFLQSALAEAASERDASALSANQAAEDTMARVLHLVLQAALRDLIQRRENGEAEP